MRRKDGAGTRLYHVCLRLCNHTRIKYGSVVKQQDNIPFDFGVISRTNPINNVIQLEIKRYAGLCSRMHMYVSACSCVRGACVRRADLQISDWTQSRSLERAK